jgi:hypothetical protein
MRTFERGLLFALFEHFHRFLAFGDVAQDAGKIGFVMQSKRTDAQFHRNALPVGASRFDFRTAAVHHLRFDRAERCGGQVFREQR